MGFGLLLYVFLFGFAAWGATEISRTYIYRGFDTNGILVVKGVITLRLNDTDRVTGDWDLRILERDREIREIIPTPDKK